MEDDEASFGTKVDFTHHSLPAQCRFAWTLSGNYLLEVFVPMPRAGGGHARFVVFEDLPVEAKPANPTTSRCVAHQESIFRV